MLKNSLYSNKFFPVYLFSGQRGCGKTTAARIFACAANCQELEQFQQDPKNNLIPCLKCISCKAMTCGQHPDFIEIDAASHTGVDHVRQIIDAAALLPALSRKKIYLIDEAHMLSKAAFNAFLKLLEEPPQSVFFILATTDPHKILETVISRCFQLFFHPVSSKILVDHLTHVCTQENIHFETDGLHAIAYQSEGSVRDALNLLEQVRFSCDIVSRKTVSQVLGEVSHEQLQKILQAVLRGLSLDVQHIWHEYAFEQFNAYNLWNTLTQFLCEVVLCALGAEQKNTYIAQDVLQAISAGRTAQELLVALDIMYTYEPTFLKTALPHNFLKYILLKISQQYASSGLPTNQIADFEKKNVKGTEQSMPDQWQIFLDKLAQVDDPLISSIFKRAAFLQLQNELVRIAYPQNFIFFKDIIESTKQIWLPELHKVFGATVQLESIFNDVDQQIDHELKLPPPQAISHKGKQEIKKTNFQSVSSKFFKRIPIKKQKSEKIIDVSDATVWQKAQLILKVFPGTVTEVMEDMYG